MSESGRSSQCHQTSQSGRVAQSASGDHGTSVVAAEGQGQIVNDDDGDSEVFNMSDIESSEVDVEESDCQIESSLSIKIGLGVAAALVVAGATWGIVAARNKSETKTGNAELPKQRMIPSETKTGKAQLPKRCMIPKEDGRWNLNNERIREDGKENEIKPGEMVTEETFREYAQCSASFVLENVSCDPEQSGDWQVICIENDLSTKDLSELVEQYEALENEALENEAGAPDLMEGIKAAIKEKVDKAIETAKTEKEATDQKLKTFDGKTDLTEQEHEEKQRLEKERREAEIKLFKLQFEQRKGEIQEAVGKRMVDTMIVNKPAPVQASSTTREELKKKLEDRLANNLKIKLEKEKAAKSANGQEIKGNAAAGSESRGRVRSTGLAKPGKGIQVEAADKGLKEGSDAGEGLNEGLKEAIKSADGKETQSKDAIKSADGKETQDKDAAESAGGIQVDLSVGAADKGLKDAAESTDREETQLKEAAESELESLSANEEGTQDKVPLMEAVKLENEKRWYTLHDSGKPMKEWTAEDVVIFLLSVSSKGQVISNRDQLELDINVMASVKFGMPVDEKKTPYDFAWRWRTQSLVDTPIDKWTVDQVEFFLAEENVPSRCIKILKDNEVDGHMLLELSYYDLFGDVLGDFGRVETDGVEVNVVRLLARLVKKETEEQFLKQHQKEVERVTESGKEKLGSYKCMQCNEVLTAHIDALGRHLEAHQAGITNRIHTSPETKEKYPSEEWFFSVPTPFAIDGVGLYPGAKWECPKCNSKILWEEQSGVERGKEVFLSIEEHQCESHGEDVDSSRASEEELEGRSNEESESYSN